MDKYTGVQVLKCFLNKIESESLPLIMLRPREISEAISYNGDYDFFINPKYNEMLLRTMFKTANEMNCSFTIQRTQYGKYNIDIYNSDDARFITLEIWNLLSVKDPLKKTLRYIDSKTLSSFIQKKGSSFYFNIEIEALYYISHLYSCNKKLSTPLVRERINYYLNKLRELKDQIIYNIFIELIEEATTIKDAAHRANMILVSKKVLHSKKDFNIVALIKESKIKIASTINRAKRKIYTLIRMTPIIGPDGVGKTTIIKNLISHSNRTNTFRFKKTFRVSPFYKLFIFIAKLNKKHKSLGKSEIDDKYGNIVILNALLMYPLRVITNLFSKKTIFIDRYFYEFLLKDVRNKSGKSALRNDWKFLLSLIPKPYMMIQLDASETIILERKQELEEKGIQAYRTKIFNIYLKSPVMVYNYVNTSIPLEKSQNIVIQMCQNNLKYFK